MLFELPSPIQELKSALFSKQKLDVYIKRDDLIHQSVSGNKWRKLKLNIEKYRQGKFEKLLTFGGAYSNHIAATAKVGEELGVPTIGIIRGDELNEASNETLKTASDCGMELIFTKREEYALRDEKYYHEELRRRHGHVCIVPEGGANFYGTVGCQEIIKEIPFDFDYIVTACGTATTAAGLLSAVGTAKVIGVSALKGGEFMLDLIRDRLDELGLSKEDIEDSLDRFELVSDAHFGGYAKHTPELIDFINEFYQEFQIKLDQVYTGKMMFALMTKIKAGDFPEGSKIIALHTGGMQGTKSIKELLLFD